MVLDFELEIGDSRNGPYCKNARQIVEKCKELGFTHKQIAEIAGGAGDPSTISGWKRNGYGDLEMCRRVYTHLKNL
jgi:hypothetical protein